MKKSILFTLSLALITASVMPLSSASRNAYHAYITAQENRVNYNHFAEGRRVSKAKTPQQILRERRANARFQRNSRINYSRPKGTMRVSEINTTYVEATSRTAVDTKLRPFATRAGVAPWRQNLRGTGRVSRVSNAALPNQMMSFETYENSTFSVEIPTQAQASANDAHTFVAKDLSIRVKRFGADTCDNAYGFRGCATNITKGENSALVGGKGRLISLDRVVRQSYKSDTVLTQVNMQTNVYTEEFTAEFPDGVIYTLYRYAVQDTDGGVYYIEVKAPAAEARNYIAVANRVFDSFRIYGQQ